MSHGRKYASFMNLVQSQVVADRQLGRRWMDQTPKDVGYSEWKTKLKQQRLQVIVSTLCGAYWGISSRLPKWAGGAFHIPGGQQLEQSLHRRFSAQRVRGEWFTPTAELMALIQEGRNHE